MTRSNRRRGSPPRRDNTILLIAGGVIAVLVVAALVFLNVTAPHQTAVVNTSGRVWGSTSAKVVIDEWSDFQ